MELLVGITSDDSGDALALAEDVARTGRMSVAVCHVLPTPWRGAAAGRVDAEWRAFLRESADEALSQALAGADPTLPRPRTHVHEHDGSGRGLTEAAALLGAAAVVIGSAPGGAVGSIHSGSTSDQLLHGSSVPVLVSPRGYRERRVPPARVTVAYQESLTTEAAADAAAQLARRLDVPLRLLTLISRPSLRFGGASAALDALRLDARRWLDSARARLSTDVSCSAEIAEGSDVVSAVHAADWPAGELLVVGSSSVGPIERVFLGDTSLKILRAASVPTWFVPRGVDPSLEHTGTIPPIR